MPESVAAHTPALLRAAGVSEQDVAAAETEARPAMVVADADVAVEIHEPRLVPSKAAALRAHTTQVMMGDGIYALSNLIWRPLLSSEYFQVGFSTVPVTGRLDGFFDGVV